MKLFNRILTITFTIILGVMLISNVLLPSREFSDQENRYLAQLPSFSMTALFNGKFTADFEEYIQDQFIGRDQWILLKTILEKYSGKQENNDVYFGKDDWYFEKKENYDKEQLDKNIGYLNDLSAFLNENDILVTFLPIYSSYMFYEELMPSNHQNYDEREILNMLLSGLENVNIIDTLETLMEHKNEQLYFKTDHHWTQIGAYYAYTLLADVYEYSALSFEEFIQVDSPNDFYGTLYSKAPLLMSGDNFFTLETDNEFEVYIKDNDTTYNEIYFYDNFDKKDQYVTYLDGNHGYVSIKSSNKNGKKLLVIKDSYSHALVPLLANHFEEIVMIDMRYYKLPVKEFILEERFDSVLYAYNVSWFANDKNLFNLKK